MVVVSGIHLTKKVPLKVFTMLSHGDILSGIFLHAYFLTTATILNRDDESTVDHSLK